MNKTARLLVLASIAASCATAAVTDVKFLHAQGTNIVCGNNKTIALNGVNLGGHWIFEKWMSPLDSTVADDRTMKSILYNRFGSSKAEDLIKVYHDSWITESDFARIAKLGMNVVRMPIYDLNFMDESGAYLSPSAPFAELDRIVNLAWSYGLYTIIDMHGVPGSQNGEEHSGRKGSSAYWKNTTAHSVACRLWEDIARHYAGNPAVAGYDLLNEPTGASGTTQWEADDEFYRVIRKVDPHHMIIIEAVWGWSDLPDPAKYNWTNVVYEFHHYEWGKDSDAQIKAIDKVISNFEKYKKWSVPCYIGEFNFFEHEAAWKYGIEKFNEYGISWTTWAYKATHGSPNDSWGIYDPKSGVEAPAIPSLETDSYETIAEKWRLWTTENAFDVNTMLTATLIPSSHISC